MPIQLIPDSWGSLREDNYCHLPDGTLAPKGQGTCQGGGKTATVMARQRIRAEQAAEREKIAKGKKEKGHNISTVEDEASPNAERELFGRETAEDVAEEMIVEVEHTLFDLSISSEGGRRSRDTGERRPDLDTLREEYEDYEQNEIERQDEANSEEGYREWQRQQQEYFGRVEEAYGKAQELFAEIQNEENAQAGQMRLFPDKRPARSTDDRADFRAETLQTLAELTDDFKKELDEEDLGYLKAAMQDSQYRADRLETLKYSHLDDVSEDFNPDGFSHWAEDNWSSEIEYDIDSFDSWVDEHYPKSDDDGGEGGDARIIISYKGHDGSGAYSDYSLITRVFYKNDNGEFEVHHDYFRAGDEAPPGMGKDLLRASMDTYEKLGVQVITTLANIDVGGYAWAKYGFLPDNPSRMTGLMKDHLVSVAGRGEPLRYKDIEFKPEREGGKPVRTEVSRSLMIPPEHYHRIMDILNSGRRTLIWEIADYKIGDFSVGKALLKNTRWDATFRLDDTEQMARFNKYVRRKTKT